MPELPEVQTIVDDLKASLLVGKRVKRVSVFWPRTIHAMSPTTFCRKIEGHRIVSIGRRGKFIVIGLETGFLLIHLRMSGRLLLTAKNHMRDKHEHVWLTFTDGNRLRYHDTRKFGRMYLVEDTHAIFQKLGPEPLSRQFTTR
jgi:formamidopyrimidine-DNA glycosylase